jgi:hypothetical protein
LVVPVGISFPRNLHYYLFKLNAHANYSTNGSTSDELVILPSQPRPYQARHPIGCSQGIITFPATRGFSSGSFFGRGDQGRVGDRGFRGRERDFRGRRFRAFDGGFFDFGFDGYGYPYYYPYNYPYYYSYPY